MKPGDLVRYRASLNQDLRELGIFGELDKAIGIVTEAFQDYTGVLSPTGVRNWVLVLWPWGLSSEQVDHLEVISEAG